MMKARAALGIASIVAGLVAWRTAGWLRAVRRGLPWEPPECLLEQNRTFYDRLWRGARLVDPRRFNTWPLVSGFLPTSPARLEVGPGLRPRLPVAGTDFVDLSQEAVAVLRASSGRAVAWSVAALPYESEAFDLVCAMDVVEHADDGDTALAELSRVTRPGGVLLLAVPLHGSRWTIFDDLAGHRERYEPEDLVEKLAAAGFGIESSAAYGMQPRWPRLSDFGMRCLVQRPEQAMRYYNLFMPIGLWLQPKLRFVEGLISGPGIDEVLLVCRKK